MYLCTPTCCFSADNGNVLANIFLWFQPSIYSDGIWIIVILFTVERTESWRAREEVKSLVLMNFITYNTGGWLCIIAYSYARQTVKNGATLLHRTWLNHNVRKDKIISISLESFCFNKLRSVRHVDQRIPTCVEILLISLIFLNRSSSSKHRVFLSSLLFHAK